MGRWAQARRTGTVAGVNADASMIEATITGTMQATVTYDRPVSAAQLGTGNFTSNPSSSVDDIINQIAPETVEINFIDPIDTDASLTFDGVAPGILTPQTIAYT